MKKSDLDEHIYRHCTCVIAHTGLVLTAIIIARRTEHQVQVLVLELKKKKKKNMLRLLPFL